MTETDASTPTTVAIIHGWAEGKRLSKRFADILTKRGFKVVNDPAVADVVFAHSLGCYLLPPDSKARRVLLVGVPLVPTERLPVALVRKLAKEARHHRAHDELGWWYKKLAYGFWCAVTKPHHIYYLFSKRNSTYLPNADDRRVLVVRPTDDPFMPAETNHLLEKRGYRRVELEGMHDDCWLDPEMYADLLEDTRTAL